MNQYPYKAYILDVQDDAYNWAVRLGYDRIYVDITGVVRIIRFRDEEDCLAFKLKFKTL